MSLRVKTLMLSLVALNLLAIIFMIRNSDQSSSSEFTKDRYETFFGQGIASKTSLDLDDMSGADLSGWDLNFFLRQYNPFRQFGSYPNVTQEYFNSIETDKTFYRSKIYGINRDPNYCLQTDLYNLATPKNIFGKRHFFTDYDSNEDILRSFVIPDSGEDLMPNISISMPKRDFDSIKFSLDKKVNMIFTKMPYLHYFLKIGTQFMCATQMYNHIPGHGYLRMQYLFLQKLEKYSEYFKERPSCFEKELFMLPKWRLYEEEECKDFFSLISSSFYDHSSKKDHVQFLMITKSPRDINQTVDLVLNNNVENLRMMYGSHGDRCGKSKDPITISTYLQNPLLLQRGNKFKIRAFMLIASTNPIIAYYHDGYINNALKPYDKFSNEFADHAYSTSLREALENPSLYGMTEEEIRGNIYWTYEDLQDYLKSSGKIKDKTWLNNYLRPAMKKSMVHLIRMTEDSFWKQSNVFELFGVDFIMDDNLDIFFEETFFSPQISTPNQKFEIEIGQMLLDLFEIEYAYYRSRMKRVLLIFKKMDQKIKENGSINHDKYKPKYDRAMMNFLNSEFLISFSNSFQPIIDRNEIGARAYFDLVDRKCVE